MKTSPFDNLYDGFAARWEPIGLSSDAPDGFLLRNKPILRDYILTIGARYTIRAYMIPASLGNAATIATNLRRLMARDGLYARLVRTQAFSA